ncbi:MAG: DUF952 domain-containing protein [Planctomycetota bacterium]
MILHLIPRAEWEAARDLPALSPASLAREGFIHFSTAEQLLATAGRYYAGRRDLLVLVVDEARCAASLRWEESRPGELFPHLYGPLERAAITAVLPLELGPDGFRLPAFDSAT